MQEGQILNQCQQLFPHLNTLLDEMKLYYTEKLWHQLTESLLKYIRDEQVLKNGQKLTEMYNTFVVNFEKHMDPIKFVRFICRISNYQGDDDQKIAFLDKIMEKSITDQQALYVCRLKRAEFQLNKKQFEEVDNIIKEIVVNLSQQSNIDTLVHSSLYKLGYEYNKIRNEYDELYKYGLQFLAYTSESDISQAEKFDLSVEMALAILISPTIYNFSELLQQPVLQSLKGSNESWIFTLLETYNSGNVEKCQQDMQNFQAQINTKEVLKKNTEILQEKIRIMAFLDLVFNQPKNQRSLSFETIANVAKVGILDVELLLMRAMSINLVKGTIDQIKQSVSIDWIIPRVLDNQRIQIMSDKLENWHKSLQEVFKTIDDVNKQQ